MDKSSDTDHCGGPSDLVVDQRFDHRLQSWPTVDGELHNEVISAECRE